MKVIGRLLIAAAVLSLVTALPVGALVSSSSMVTAAEELEVVHLEIEGMVCGACQAKVKTALSELPEVQEVEVSWESGGADVKVTKGSDHKNLKKAVQEAGFTVTEVEVITQGLDVESKPT